MTIFIIGLIAGIFVGYFFKDKISNIIGFIKSHLKL